MPFRLVALDLDGTALDSTFRFRPSTEAAIAAALRHGIDVVLVTARHHVAVHPYHAQLRLRSPAICCNGTYVYDFTAPRVLVGDPIGKDQARWLLSLVRRCGVHCCIYTGASMTFEVENAHMRRFRIWAESLAPAVRPDIRQIDSFERVIDEADLIWKFLVSHDDANVLSAWQAEAARSGAFSIEFSWKNRLDVVRSGNSKGQRLLEWAATRGIDPADIMAFGDNHNDVTMIRSVGMGVAMGNGEDVVKAVAARVIGDNQSDDIAGTIERFAIGTALRTG
jgi:Cof subfamily protein (haloacid dehalogenase superfamily)